MFKYIDVAVNSKYKNPGWIIIDDDFEEYISCNSAMDAVIIIYESKSLNVAANTVLFFKWHQDKFNNNIFPIKYENIKTLKYEQYEEEINKYLLLL